MSGCGNSELRRLARRVWPGNNPLRRRTDRFEAWALIGIVLLAAVSLIFAIGVSQAVLRDEMAAVRAEHAARHQVTATVVTQLDRPTTRATVVVRWGPPDRESFGVTTVDQAAHPETTLRVWVDQQNRLTPGPTSPAAATQTAGVAAASVLIGCMLCVAVCYGCARWWVNRRRLAAWAAEWEWVGPQWRRRTGG